MPGKAGVSDDAEFVRRALDAGHELHFFVPAGGKLHSEEMHPNLHVHQFRNIFPPTRSWPTLLRRPLWFGYFVGPVARGAVRCARRVEPDIVLGFSYLGAAGAERVGRALGIPSVVKHFGVYTAAFFRVWSRAKYLYKNYEILTGLKRRVDAMIILNDGSLGKEAAVRAGFPAERVHFLLNGIHTEWAQLDLDGAAERRKLEIPEGEGVLLFLARLEPFKGTAQLRRVLAKLMAAPERPLHLLVAGSGPDEGMLREAAAALPADVSKRVRFLGAVPHDDVPNLFAAADCFLTINTYSNMAIPTCEAMVCGTPVIASDVTGTAETVIDGRNGLLVPEDDDDALVAAVARIMDDGKLRADLANGAAEFARERFDSWDRRVARELDLIDRLCEQGRSIG